MYTKKGLNQLSAASGKVYSLNLWWFDSSSHKYQEPQVAVNTTTDLIVGMLASKLRQYDTSLPLSFSEKAAGPCREKSSWVAVVFNSLRRCIYATDPPREAGPQP